MDLNNNGHRKDFIDDFLKKKGKFVEPQKLSPEQQIFANAMKIYESVWGNNVNPLLRALKSPSEYQPTGTQLILLDALKTRFNGWSKDELVFLVSAMHCEEMEKRCKQIVEQGRVGENFGKEI